MTLMRVKSLFYNNYLPLKRKIHYLFTWIQLTE